MADLAQIISQIRFQLNELSARNAHHLFEELCLHLARARLHSNLVPATGPVAAGGDGGRDFETYPSHLEEESSAAGTFLARAAQIPIAFACTLQATLPSKIRADVKKCALANPPFQTMYFMAASNLPVAMRQRLMAWAKEKHEVELHVLDGQALASMLADPEVFWIAVRYLNLPSELFPQMDDEDWYNEARHRWSSTPQPDFTDAEYHDIRTASRHAVATLALKADLGLWIERLEAFAQHARDMLQRKADYEVLFTHLRGLGTLIGQEERLRRYMNAVPLLENVNDLEDASTMLMWAFGAEARGVLGVSDNEIMAWFDAIEARTDELLLQKSSTGARCRLLETQAFLIFTRPDGSSPKERAVNAHSSLDELASLISESPLYPVERLVKRLNEYTRLLGDIPELDPIFDILEPLVGKQRGNAAEAEAARNRAVRAWKSGDLLRAVQHAQRAKLLWFSERTLRGSVLTLIFLSRLYQELNLHLAAKQYALAAAYLAYQSQDLRDKALVPKALLLAADEDYVQGAWASFLDLIGAAFLTYNALSRNASQSEQDDGVAHALQHLFLLSGMARKLGGVADAYVQNVLKQWGMDLEDYFDGVEGMLAQFAGHTDEHIRASVAEQLHGPPFSDLGAQRRVIFKALGMTWTASWRNDPHITAAAEEFLAGLQVLIADVASSDLCILPLQVHLNLDWNDALEYDLIPQPHDGSDHEISFRVILPGGLSSKNSGLDLMTATTHLLMRFSLVPDDELFILLGERFKEGLLAKLYVARPYRELVRQFVSFEEVEQSGRAEREVLWPDRVMAPGGPLLEWQIGPGPKYDQAEALNAVRNRYENIISRLQYTLPRLATDALFQQVLLELRSEGWRDWHVLLAVFNLALNLRTPLRPGARPPAGPPSETAASSVLSLAAFTAPALRQHLKIAQVATLRSMGLDYKLPLIVTDAVNRVLAERYRYWNEDIEHDDPFVGRAE